MAEKELQRKLFNYLNIDTWDSFVAAYRQTRAELGGASNFSRFEIVLSLCHRYGVPPDADLFTAWEQQYWERVKDRTRLFPEVYDVLATLRTAHRLALITNTQGQKSDARHRLRQYPSLEHSFEVVIVAGEGGIPPKPDPRPFLTCLDRLGIAAGHALYVGDDWRIDVCGSQAAGLHPVWLRHHLVTRHWPEVETSVPVIHDLTALIREKPDRFILR
jgi:HAD superfamily hydrolase (TIGR01549 family)